MTCVYVKTQTELDAALSGDATCVHIESEAGVRLRVGASGSATVQASGSATVQASGSATVQASGSATVRASGSATVQASGSASIHADDRTKVTATSHVAVHLHSAQAAVTGGVLIDLTQLDLDNPATWCAHHGIDVVAGHARLYKAVDGDLTAGHNYIRTVYPIGETVTCTDWRDDNDCGGGLHASPRPWQAHRYANSGKVRYLLVSAPVESIRPIEDDKCKAPAWSVLSEVDASGRELAAAQGGAAS